MKITILIVQYCKNIFGNMSPSELFERVESSFLLENPTKLRTEDIYLGDFGLAKRLDDPFTQRG